MKPSTRLLWTWFLPGMVACGILQGVAFFLFSLGGLMWETWVPGLMAAVAAALTLLQGFNTRLFNFSRFFPVEPHQAAWIPLQAWAILWGVGLTVQLAGQFFSMTAGEGSLRQFLDYWRLVLPTLPCLVFLILVLFHVVRNDLQDNLWSYWYLWLNLTIYLNRIMEWIARQQFAWPLFIGGVVVLVRAAPANWTTLRRQAYTWKEGTTFHSYVINEGGRKLSTPALDLAHSILYALAALAMMAWLDALEPWQNVRSLFLAPQRLPYLKTHPASLFYAITMIAAPFGLAYAVWNLRRAALASGIPRRRAWLAAALKMSLIFEPLARRMGMQRGSLERCPACHGPRFAWQARCPHCQRAEVVQPEQAEGEPATKPAFWEVAVSKEENTAAAFYRMIIPGLLIVFAYTILKAK